ncbi:MAG: hypothetical protein K9N51_01060 [Candidatus Pacebacteria bacterium]|nr:hypothetical protein [Candidatus Paceibacterota bacterium]
MFTKDWDESVGLWWSTGDIHNKPICHLERTHRGPDAAGRLLTAAQLGQLREIDVAAVLAALRKMVWTVEGPKYGCIKWYWEDPEPCDTNAAFFTGLPLVTLRIVFADQLEDQELHDLDWILEKLSAWFLRCCAERHEHYPNKYLGDLVCAWLILECTGGDGADTVAASMRRSAKYWSGKGGWGWGEHIGNYINVLLDELSALLLLARRLPDDIRADYLSMLNELLAIEDSFQGGPCVPTLRNYAFTESPRVSSYREYVQPWAPDEKIKVTNRAPLRNLLAERGWHDLVAPPADPPACPRTVSVPCFGGATAHAYIDQDIRLGGMSHFPVMDWAEGVGWGLSWQCFPVALWRPAGDWGFLLWHAVENDVWRSHPMGVERTAETPRQLTETVNPPIIGRTESILHAGDLVAARYMPERPTSWPRSGDGFRIVRTDAQTELKEQSEAWHRLLLRWPDRAVSVEFVNLTDDRAPELRENEFGGYDWLIHYDPECHGPAMGLWRISLSNDDRQAPVIEPADVPAQPRPAGGRAVHVNWNDRRFLLDPLAAPMITEDTV